jgi:hypothetical protein
MQPAALTAWRKRVREQAARDKKAAGLTTATATAGSGWRKEDAEALVCRLIVLGVLREFFQHTVGLCTLNRVDP